MSKLALIHKMYQSTSIETLNEKLIHPKHTKNQTMQINRVHQLQKKKIKVECGDLDPDRHNRLSISLLW